jgi:hypothetical protein
MDTTIKINLTILLQGRGTASKDNAALKSAYQNVKVSKEAYLYFIGEDKPHGYKGSSWKTSKKSQRLQWHLKEIAEALGGKIGEYTILPD